MALLPEAASPRMAMAIAPMMNRISTMNATPDLLRPRSTQDIEHHRVGVLLPKRDEPRTPTTGASSFRAIHRLMFGSESARRPRRVGRARSHGSGAHHMWMSYRWRCVVEGRRCLGMKHRGLRDTAVFVAACTAAAAH